MPRAAFNSPVVLSELQLVFWIVSLTYEVMFHKVHHYVHLVQTFFEALSRVPNTWKAYNKYLLLLIELKKTQRNGWMTGWDSIWKLPKVRGRSRIQTRTALLGLELVTPTRLFSTQHGLTLVERVHWQSATKQAVMEWSSFGCFILRKEYKRLLFKKKKWQRLKSLRNNFNKK